MNVRGTNICDSYEDGGFEASKTTTVTKMATLRGSIPMTVGTFEAWGGGGWGDTMAGEGGLANREPA